MDCRITIAIAAAALMAPTAFAQTATQSAPPEIFKFLSAKEVAALTDKPGSGPKTAHLAEHETHNVEYALRTDSGNQAEVHAHTSHYIQILAGEGTLTYGGSVNNPKQTGAGQIRGDAIDGGTTITVHEGDYVQIPAGTPHLFVAAPGTTLHYVVFNTNQ